MIFVGIDPGDKGAIGFVDEHDIMPTEIHDMPKQIGKTLRIILKKYLNEKLFVFIESSVFLSYRGTSKFLINYGKILGVVETLDLKYIEVAPLTWKAEFNLNKRIGEKEIGKKSQIEYRRKLKSVEVAQRLFPNIKFYTEKGRMLDGRADALLIAEYGKRLLTKKEEDNGRDGQSFKKKRGKRHKHVV